MISLICARKLLLAYHDDGNQPHVRLLDPESEGDEQDSNRVERLESARRPSLNENSEVICRLTLSIWMKLTDSER